MLQVMVVRDGRGGGALNNIPITLILTLTLTLTLTPGPTLTLDSRAGDKTKKEEARVQHLWDTTHGATPSPQP